MTHHIRPRLSACACSSSPLPQLPQHILCKSCTEQLFLGHAVHFLSPTSCSLWNELNLACKPPLLPTLTSTYWKSSQAGSKPFSVTITLIKYPLYLNHALPQHGSLQWGQEVVVCLVFLFCFSLLQLTLHLLATILCISLGMDWGWGARWREKREAQEGLS